MMHGTATRPYGPNSHVVQRFLARLARLDAGQLLEVVDTWRTALRHSNGWYAAEDSVGDAIARTRRFDEQWTLQERVYELFRAAPWYTGRRTTPGPATEPATQYLASTAALALLVADELPRGELTCLYEPFAGVVPLGELWFDVLLPAGRPPARPRPLSDDTRPAL